MQNGSKTPPIFFNPINPIKKGKLPHDRKIFRMNKKKDSNDLE